jgi:hypothetical protein
MNRIWTKKGINDLIYHEFLKLKLQRDSKWSEKGNFFNYETDSERIKIIDFTTKTSEQNLLGEKRKENI